MSVDYIARVIRGIEITEANDTICLPGCLIETQVIPDCL